MTDNTVTPVTVALKAARLPRVNAKCAQGGHASQKFFQTRMEKVIEK